MRTRRTAALLGMGMLAGAAPGQECGPTAVAALGGFASEITALPDRRVAVARGMALELYSLEDPTHPELVDRLDQTVLHEHWGRFDRLASSGAIVCAVQHGWLARGEHEVPRDVADHSTTTALAACNSRSISLCQRRPTWVCLSIKTSQPS